MSHCVSDKLRSIVMLAVCEVASKLYVIYMCDAVCYVVGRDS